MSLSWCRLGRFSNVNPGMLPTRRRMRSVGSLRWLVSKAFEGQWLKLVMILCTCVWAMKPLFVFFSWRLLRVLYPFVWPGPEVGGSPNPASLSVHCMPSVGKFGRSPMAYLIALLRIPSIVESWRSLKTPRWVA